jgi:hypothetical protein
MRLIHPPKDGDGDSPGRLEHSVGRANYIIERYGFHAFLTDLDSGRDYWREVGEWESIIHSCMSWLVDEGFNDFFSQFEELTMPHGTRLQWQQRYLISLWKA